MDGNLVTEWRSSSPAVDLPKIPEALRDFIAVNSSANIVYVQHQQGRTPIFHTWMARCHSAGVLLKTKYVEMDELSVRREHEILPDRSPDLEMATREEALALIRRAADLGASDVHILVRARHTELQIRVNGEMTVLDRTKTQAEGEAICRALYQSIATSSDSSYNPREFQNAQISGSAIANTGLSSIRLVRGPSFPVEDGGCFTIMRLQTGNLHAAKSKVISKSTLTEPRRPEGQLRLSSMGFTALQEEKMRFMAEAPSGVIILSGPTGSGKTSTIFELMTHLARESPGRREVTIEDPIEYPMPWAVQLEVTGAQSETETGRAFAERLRVALRMDPDIIMCGEIRGADVAMATVNAALTGHLVLTTVHVTDPFLTVERMEMMDRDRLNRRVFCDHTIIRGLVSQRLVPKLCLNCSKPLGGHEDRLPAPLLSAVATYGNTDNVRIRGDGCDACRSSGIAGRLAVAEVVVTTPQLMADFIDHGTHTARRNHRAREGSDKSLLENTMDRVLEGLVDPRDVSKHVDLVVPRDAVTP